MPGGDSGIALSELTRKVGKERRGRAFQVHGQGYGGVSQAMQSA